MQFSPNIYIRYASSLRIYLQKRIYKKGIDYKTLKLLRNIILFEIIFCQKGFYETDLFYFFDRLSCAISAECLKRSHWVNISVNGIGNGKINRNAMVYILCQCFNANNISIKIAENFIIIKTNFIQINKVVNEILKVLGGVLLRDIKNNKYGIFLPFKRCKNPVLKSPDEYDYLFNPLSTLKVFLPPHKKP